MALRAGQKAGDFCRVESAELVREDCKRLNLATTYNNKPLKFHSLRHTFSHMLETVGADENQIGVLMGHKATTTVRTNYLGKNIEHFRKLVEAMPVPEYVTMQDNTVIGQKPKGMVLAFKKKA